MKSVMLLLGLWWAHQASGATHSLKYFYTASSEVPDFPEFVVVGVLDEVQFFHFDSNSQQAVAKQDWLNKLAETNPQYFQRETQNLQGTDQTYRANIDILKQRFNQTGGVHTFQRMYGCQWDDSSDQTDAFEQFGYDGSDFIIMDVKNKVHIAPVPEAVITKQKWDTNRGWLDGETHYLTQICIEWLKKYVKLGRSALTRKVAPEVSLFKDASLSEVVCHATGFYPEGMMITWKKDGEEMQEDVNIRETLTNADGTFQKRAVLTVSPEEWKKNKYTCDVAHTSGSISKAFNPDDRSSNDRGAGSVSVGLIVGILAVVLLVGCIIGFLLWRKMRSNSGFVPANKDDVSASSDETPRKV